MDVIYCAGIPYPFPTNEPDEIDYDTDPNPQPYDDTTPPDEFWAWRAHL